MQDEPSPDEIIAAVAAQLRAAGGGADRSSFQDRVAAGALDLARRALALGPAAEAIELQGLRALLRDDGDLPTLNAELSARLRDGRLGLQSAGVRDHLWATTLAKLAVDQPRYATYRAVLAERPAADEET